MTSAERNERLLTDDGTSQGVLFCQLNFELTFDLTMQKHWIIFGRQGVWVALGVGYTKGKLRDQLGGFSAMLTNLGSKSAGFSLQLGYELR